MHPGLLLQSPGHPSVCHASLDGCMLDMQAHSVDMRRALNASGLAVAMPGTHFSGSGQPSWWGLGCAHYLLVVGVGLCALLVSGEGWAVRATC